MKTAKCECGNSKDPRSNQCRSCGSRSVAQAQWQRMRSRMEKSLRAFAATRKGKPIKPKRFCSIGGCSEPYESRGWCHKHYARWKHHGSPDIQRLTPEEYFWANVRKTRTCWIWTGSINDSGYGIITVDGRRERAHRYAYFLAYGKWPIPIGRHTCDNPPCVRFDHIVEGTQTNNMADKIGRNRQLRGSQVGGAKLTEGDVLEIKRMLKNKVFQKDIAAAFNVHQSTISEISAGKTWKHIV